MLGRHANIGDIGLDLLSEVADICDANGIEYFLAPQIVKRAIDDLDFNTYFIMPEIYMTAGSVKKFIEAAERDMPEGRALDYLGNNKNYIGFNVSYVNENTTYIALARGLDFSRLGIKVKVSMLCDDTKKRLPAFVETGREENAFRAEKKGKWKKRVVSRLLTAADALGGSNFNRKLFDYYVRSYSRDPQTPRVFVRSFRQKRRYFDRGIFSERVTVSLNGRSFYAPKRIEEYLTVHYGPGALEMEIAEFKRPNNLISCRVPYREYLDSLEKKGIPIETIFDQMNEVRADRIYNDELMRSVEEVYTAAQMSEERMILYARLSENIDQIRRLYSEKDYDSLTKIFSEYDARARYYIKQGLTLCTDEEQFEILCDIMENRGATERVRLMRSKLLEKHKKPLIRKERESTVE